MPVHVVTYGTDAKKLEPLLASARLHNVPIQNLCKTTVWTNFDEKLNAVKEFIANCNDTDIVCFLDAYDVLVNQPLDIIKKVFLESKAAILFGAEKQLHPSYLSFTNYPSNSTDEFPYLNSGVYIGYVSAIRCMMNSPLNTYKDDQEFCNRYFVKYHASEAIQVDTVGKFALNMFKVSRERIYIESGHIVYASEQSPCFVHFNGMSFLDFETDFTCTEKGNYVWNGQDVSVERLIKYVEAKQVTLTGRFLCYTVTKSHSSLV